MVYRVQLNCLVADFAFAILIKYFFDNIFWNIIGYYTPRKLLYQIQRPELEIRFEVTVQL